MITKATKEDLRILYNLRNVQNGFYIDPQQLYVSQQFIPENTLLNRVNGTIRSSMQINYYPVYFKGQLVQTSHVLGMLGDTRGEYFDQLMSDALEEQSYKTLFTVIPTSDEKKFYKFGFVPLYKQRVYTINKNDIKEINVQSVGKDFTIDEISNLYQRYTAHFTGYEIRRKEDWLNLIDWWVYSHHNIAVYRNENNEVQGYIVYTIASGKVLVNEMVYLNGLAILRLMAFAAKIRNNIEVRVSENENLSLAIKGIQYKVETSAVIRINDLELFNKLYETSVETIQDGLKIDSKPLWFSTGY